MLSLVNQNKRKLSKISCGSGRFMLSCVTVAEYRHEVVREYFIFFLCSERKVYDMHNVY